jgi:preprotein translocase subunit SecA
MFNAMMDGIKEESVGALFNLQVEVQENPITEEAAEVGGQPEAPGPAAAGPAAAAPPWDAAPRPPDAAPPPGPASGDAVRARAGAGARGPAAGNRGDAAAGRRGGKPRGGTEGNVPSPPLPAGFTPSRSTAQLEYTAPSVDGGTHVERHAEAAGNGEFSRVGRNDPCPCGSGRKFKRCHGDPRTRATG